MSAAGRTIPVERVALGGANVLSCLVRLETLQGIWYVMLGTKRIWRIRLKTGGLAHVTELARVFAAFHVGVGLSGRTGQVQYAP